VAAAFLGEAQRDQVLSKRIVVLSEEVANQIAAGEVVERPASIVKELVENAIDAKATDIRIELEKGGCQSIRIVDNGSGIVREDVALAFERHATSKIRKLEDIYSTGSFGFRGEAMASIASIARMEMLTRRPEDLAGTRAIAQAGALTEITPAGCRPGTQITVSDIFANVPARRKFLKTEATEQSVCLDAVTRLALAHRDVRFTMTADGREVFAAPLAANISDRVAMILGADFAGHCFQIDEQKEHLRLQGYVSAPSYTRSNSKSIYLFVNSRFIRDNSLTHALLAAYRQVIEPRRYPAAVLFLELPGEDVDVNVHPAKLEVRFKNARDIYDLVSRTVAQALAHAQTSPDAFSYRLTPRETTSVSSGFWKPKTSYAAPAGMPDVFSKQTMKQAIAEDLFSRTVAEADVPFGVEDPSCGQRITFADRTYLGQFAGTYLVFEGPDGLMLLDQHAAHERILLERLKAAQGDHAATQPLLMPDVVSLSPAQISLIEGALELLGGIGLDVEIFGRDAVVVKAMPVSLGMISPRDVMTDLADQLSDQQTLSLTERREKIMASLACRGAVKANAQLSAEEVAALCRDLERTPYNATCPHGRPISVQFSLYEIERLFKRK
jgi:DNA mismatch repair protein MutL